MRFNNEVEQEGISMFPELLNSRTTNKWKVQQVEKALNNLLGVTISFWGNCTLRD